MADYGDPVMHDFVSTCLWHCYLWHHITQDEDVAPAWVAVWLAKPPLWERRQGFGTGDPRWTGGPNLRLLWHVLMFVDAMQCIIFSGERVRNNHPKKGGADDKGVSCYPPSCCGHRRSSVAMLEAHRQLSAEQGITQKAL